MNKPDVQVFLLQVGVINTPQEGMSGSEQQGSRVQMSSKQQRSSWVRKQIPRCFCKECNRREEPPSRAYSLPSLPVEKSSRMKQTRKGRKGQCVNLGVA